MNFSSCANDNDYQKQTQVIIVIICRIILVLSLTHLAGCSETPSRDAEWQEYLQRLTANLDQTQRDFLVDETLQTWQRPWQNHRLDSPRLTHHEERGNDRRRELRADRR